MDRIFNLLDASEPYIDAVLTGMFFGCVTLVGLALMVIHP